MNAEGIKGITKTSLWIAWKSIRKELRRATIRDVVDYLEYDINPEVWIKRLLKQVANGTYEPRTPSRFTIAKSKGFSRRMTMPAIPDLVLYRTIGTYLKNRLHKHEHKYVYFERAALSKATQETKKQAEKEKLATGGNLRNVIDSRMDYESHSNRRMHA